MTSSGAEFRSRRTRTPPLPVDHPIPRRRSLSCTGEVAATCHGSGARGAEKGASRHIQHDDITVRPGAQFMRGYASFAESMVTDVLGFRTSTTCVDGEVGLVARSWGPDAISAVTAAALRNKLRQYGGFLFGEDEGRSGGMTTRRSIGRLSWSKMPGWEPC